MGENSRDKYNLIVVAHPDDETIFFSGLIHNSELPCEVLCMTDGNADGMGTIRKEQFYAATAKLGVSKGHWAGLPDIYENRLEYGVQSHIFDELPTPAAVYTHGPVGEYMHPHHQDVCYAVHRFWSPQVPVFSVAYNCFPDKVVTLDESLYQLKADLISNVYGSETKRFLNLIPCSALEAFVNLTLEEVTEIYHRLTGITNKIDDRSLNKFRWLKDYIEYKANQKVHRIF